MQSGATAMQRAGFAQVAFRPATGRLAARRSAPGVVCMAHPRRVAKVAKQIEREVGNLLITDKILQAAVCPERARGYDGALSALASVTEVVISNDLQVAKVYLSIYSDEPGKAAAMEGLQRLEGYVRKHIGRQVRLRLTPEIRFVRDDSIERSERIFKLLDQVKKIERGEAEPPPLAFYGDDEEEDEEADSDDEGWQGGELGTVDLGLFGGGSGGQQRQEKRQPAAASASGRPAAGGGPRRQGGSGGGGQRRQQQQRRQQPEAPEAERGAEEGDEELEAMLEQFKRQVQQRQGRA